MARYLPLGEGIAQLGLALLTSHSLCTFPARSTKSKVEVRPVALLVTNSALESADQSTEVRLFQSFTVMSREDPVASDNKWMRVSSAAYFANASDLPSGERPQFQ